jgi:hypothetical protein
MFLTKAYFRHGHIPDLAIYLHPKQGCRGGCPLINQPAACLDTEISFYVLDPTNLNTCKRTQDPIVGVQGAADPLIKPEVVLAGKYDHRKYDY